jgi:hypothetical protein
MAMTFKAYGTQACFVYITLPGEVQAVTAGHFKLVLTRQGVTKGQFIYGKSYLAEPGAVEIDPMDLILQPQRYETAAHGGLFAALRDAGPDYWGRLVIERHAGKTELGKIDYLLRSRDRWSYMLLAEALRRVSGKPEDDLVELYRRMCFNALISNIDDHPRNHAIIAHSRTWGLSPAYDLTPSTPVSLERRDLAMACGDRGGSFG